MRRESTVSSIEIPTREGKSQDEFLNAVNDCVKVCVKAIKELRQDVKELQDKLEKRSG